MMHETPEGDEDAFHLHDENPFHVHDDAIREHEDEDALHGYHEHALHDQRWLSKAKAVVPQAKAVSSNHDEHYY
jgi:hypothetical protein